MSTVRWILRFRGGPQVLVTMWGFPSMQEPPQDVEVALRDGPGDLWSAPALLESVDVERERDISEAMGEWPA